MTDNSIGSHCARCLRANPDPDPVGDSLPWDWEYLNADGEPVGVVCPDCITPEEQQAMDNDMWELEQRLRPRDERGRFQES
jgi:hypothetical protein